MKSSRDPGFVRKLTIEEKQYPCYTLYKFHKLRLMHDMHCSHADAVFVCHGDPPGKDRAGCERERQLRQAVDCRGDNCGKINNTA